MKLYTNSNNPATYKILISALYSKVAVELVEVSTSDKRFQCPKRLPVLETDTGNVIFSSNAASLFLYDQQESKEKIESWLEWDSIKFQPVLGSKSDKITPFIDHINSSLKSKQFLVGNNISVADICVWSSFYPLVVNLKCKNELLNNSPYLLSWFENLRKLEFFQRAERKFPIAPDLALQAFLASSWYPTQAAHGDAAVNVENVVNHVTDEMVASALISWDHGSKSRKSLTKREAPILPILGDDNILITSALPYVNNVPHLGNIIGCVLSADVFARYCRLRSRNTLFICGTDEYGTATETKALEERITPQQICDKYFAIHDEVYKWFNISFDYFGRTTTPQQKEICQQVFKACHANGYTTTESVDQLLCQQCNRYLADRFVEGICPRCKYEDARGDQCDGCGHLINAVELINPRCKVCQSSPVVKQSEQLFLNLPKVEEALSDWVEKTSDGWSHNAKVITKAWLKEGLKPRCITRDLKWGVPVPLKGFENKVFYVWFDAPIGYMSITKKYTKDWLKWWKPENCVDFYQFMAKDNVPFHSIMFPATLIATEQSYATVNHLMATEYLNYENGKFSKSRGIGVFGNDAKDTGIPSDIFRFYLLYIRPENQDTNFSWADLAMKNNTELLNNLGNFIMRSLSFAEKFFDSVVPPVVIGLEEKELLGNIRIELLNYVDALNICKLRDGIKYILNISRHGNQYMQSLTPWVLIKGDDCEKQKASTVIGMLCNIVCLIASLLSPYMPDTTKMISEQLNLSLDLLTIEDTFAPYLEPGHKIGKPFPLFKKIEQTTVDELKARYSGKQKSTTPPPTLCSGDLEKEIEKQGNLVRSLKSSGKTKEEIQTNVNILLDLKKQLSNLKPTANSSDKAKAILALEENVAKQAEIVRSLKAAGKSKDEVKGEVDILLDLKKSLAGLKGEPTADSQTKTSSKKNKKNKT